MTLSSRTWLYPTSFTDRAIFAVAYGNGTFMAVSTGLVGRSQDGLQWETDEPTDLPLYDVAYFHGGFVACGEAGTIARYEAGVWSVQSVRSDVDLNSITATKDRLLCVGSQGCCLESKDGVHWTEVPTPIDSALWGVADSGTVCVAVGQRGAIMVADSSLLTWIQVQGVTTDSLCDVAYGSGLFVAIGEQGTVLTSKNGLAWNTSPSMVPDLGRVKYVSGRFVALGMFEGVMAESVDGTTWEPSFLVSNHCLLGLAKGINQVVSVGFEGAICVAQIQ